MFLPKALESGILFFTFYSSVLLAKPLISGILLSTVVILPSISVIFELNVVELNQQEQ